MLLGPVEAAIRRPKGTNPWCATIICIASALYTLCFTLVDPFVWPDSVLVALLGTPFLIPQVYAVWYLVLGRNVMGVAGITSFLCVAAAVLAFKPFSGGVSFFWHYLY
jgi:hypothetical protein